MEIEIDFNQNVLANDFYNDNKLNLNKSIKSCLNMGDDHIFIGATCRIPTTHYLDNKSIKALNFVVNEKNDNTLILILTSIEV